MPRGPALRNTCRDPRTSLPQRAFQHERSCGDAGPSRCFGLCSGVARCVWLTESAGTKPRDYANRGRRQEEVAGRECSHSSVQTPVTASPGRRPEERWPGHASARSPPTALSGSVMSFVRLCTGERGHLASSFILICASGLLGPCDLLEREFRLLLRSRHGPLQIQDTRKPTRLAIQIH
jgi:hypothetical protein